MDENARTIPFSYWTDPMCIWAFVAEAKLDRILAERGPCLDMEHRIVPVFGSLPWRFSKGPWAKSGVEGRVAETREVAAEFGHADVDGECWRQDLPASSWSPAVAVKAVTALEDAGEAERGASYAYLRALRSGFFVERLNVARRTVQLEVAEGLGLARGAIEARLDDGTALAALWEDHHMREEMKVQGSPTYLFDGGRARLYGNFDYGILRATIDELIKGLPPGASAC